MSTIIFEKAQLVNLEYSLNREMLRSNRAGSYACTTIINCNTRKYHGLLVVPVEYVDGRRHVILSSLDETIIQRDCFFNLALHKYSGDIYSPKGHKYVRSFEADIVPTLIYRVGGVILKKESIFIEHEEQFLARYTLLEAHSPTVLRLQPFLAFRSIHALSKCNMYANSKTECIDNGIKIRLYQGYPFLNMQVSHNMEYIHAPDWYYNIEYIKEEERGYEFKEDLLAPGFMDIEIKPDEPVVFSASTKEIDASFLCKQFDDEIKKRLPRTSLKNCLVNASQQFVMKKNNNVDLIAGFPWYFSRVRDTFISLPGITIPVGDSKTFFNVVDTYVKKTGNNRIFTDFIIEENETKALDVPLWFIWALQQYNDANKDDVNIWSKYGSFIKTILNSYRNNLPPNTRLLENGLICNDDGIPYTWMNSYVNGEPVTLRKGCAIEVNALWYNALQFCMELAAQAKDTDFIEDWRDSIVTLDMSFVEAFWDKEKKILKDVAYFNGDLFDVRPNQLIAISMKYSPLSKEMKKLALDIVIDELLTPRGIRTLSPKNKEYKPFYKGAETERNLAFHQGSAWPWLLQHFTMAYLNIYKEKGIPYIKNIINGFDEEMSIGAIGSVSELYNGSPPHEGHGAISYAPSVAAILYMMFITESYTD